MVQRVLGAHEDVATASEPWLLLPLLLPLRNDIPAAGSWQPQIHTALSDFSRAIPDGLNTYEKSIGTAALAIYDQAAQGAPFFLDKTPPYFLIIDEIVRTLPDARIVVLWRNPLAVLASVVETFCDGRWRPQDYPTSLFGGLTRLIEGSRRHADRVHTVRYEELIGGDEHVWRRLTEFIGIEFDPASLQHFSKVHLQGAMGDLVGTKAYSSLDTEPTEKWRGTISNPVRRFWAGRYLEWIGADRLAFMGYDRSKLCAELSATEMSLSGSGRDAGEALVSMARDAVKARLTRPGANTSVWSALFSAPSQSGVHG